MAYKERLMGYKVQTENFEGPLDLLVYLIESSKMDINDIKVSEITRQYLSYIEKLQSMDIELSMEFMVLASTLINLKSKYMLPSSQSEDTISEEIDSKEKLALMILEYKKFKKAGQYLGGLEEEARYVVEKPMEDFSHIIDNPLEILSLKEEEFLKAFEKFLVKKKRLIEIRKNYDNIQRKKITAEERISYINHIMKSYGDEEIDFYNVVKNRKDPYDVALSFTAMLELVKQRNIKARQDGLYSQIKLRKNIECGEEDE